MTVFTHPLQQPAGSVTKNTDGRLLPAVGDSDAAYTHTAYDLDDARKVEIRQARLKQIEESLQALKDGPGLLESLMNRLGKEPLGESADLLGVAEVIRKSIEIAAGAIRRYAAIPRDADPSCRCGRNDHHRVPIGLAEQLLDIALPA